MFKLITCTLVAFIFYIVASGTENTFAQEYSLDDLYRIALERAEVIKISEEGVYIAERGKDKALSVLLPKLSTFWDYTRYSEAKTTGTWVIQPDYSTSWGLRLDQSMSLSGKELKAFKISKENIEKSGYDLYAVREGYLFSIASAYYDVLRAKKALEIARANMERLIKHRDAAAIRLKVGEVTKTDLLRAEAELSGAQSEMVKAENNLKLAKAVLARIVGIYEEYTLKETPLEEPVYLFLPSLREEARMQRAELKSSELQKKIAEDQVKYAKGAYWPTLCVEGVYSGKDEDPASPFFLKESIYGGLTLNFPFFEGGLRRAEVREAKARQRQSELIYEDLRKTINIEVENAYLDFMTQKGVLKSLEDEVTFARDNYNSISRQYEFGLANSIDVIDANTLLLTSERQLSDAQYNYELAILRVERATGTLLKTVLSKQ
ncbi:MAG: TolC family protein [Nitrospirota bacterium]